jgi:hypothetical protein
VALALDELVGAALSPDRLADAPQPASAAGVGVDELAPGGDDARRVDADLGHVGEVTRSAALARALAQTRDLRGADDDEVGSSAATACAAGSVPSTKPSSPA